MHDYGSGGSLRSLLDRFQKLEEKISAIYIKQILNGLIFCHRFDVAHRDLKCSNILIDAAGTIKLSDFGCCKYFDSPTETEAEASNEAQQTLMAQKIAVPMKGSTFWMAPEVIVISRSNFFRKKKKIRLSPILHRINHPMCGV